MKVVIVTVTNGNNENRNSMVEDRLKEQIQ